MSGFKEAILNEFNTWKIKGFRVKNFKIIAKHPFVKITESDESESLSTLSLLDFKRLINTKLDEFFNKTEVLKNGFIKNRKFKNVQMVIESAHGKKFNIAMHNEKLVFCKKVKIYEKISLPNILEFSLFTQDFSSIHKLLGWCFIESEYYYVYEYLDTSLEFFLSRTEVTVTKCKELISSFIKGCQEHRLRNLDLIDIELYIKSNQVIITFPCEIRICESQSNELTMNCIRSLISQLTQACNTHLEVLPHIASSTDVDNLLSQICKLIKS